MTDTSTPPPTPPPAPDETSIVKNLLQAVVALLPILGIAVPTVLTSDSTLNLVAGLLVSAAGSVATLWMLWSHKAKNTTLAQVRAAATFHKEDAASLKAKIARSK